MFRPFTRVVESRAGKAVFLDKDGTLVQDVPYNIDFSSVQFRPDVFDALKRLQKAGYLLFIVSNQSGVARGYFSMQQVNDHFRQLIYVIRDHGVKIIDFFICPHNPDEEKTETCTCHKPRNGLLLTAAKQYGLSLQNSWMVGDILNDVEAGNTAGCRSILLDVGNETIWDQGPQRKPVFIAASLTETAEYICKNGCL